MDCTFETLITSVTLFKIVKGLVHPHDKNINTFFLTGHHLNPRMKKVYQQQLSPETLSLLLWVSVLLKKLNLK